MPPRSRRRSRIAAFQALYEADQSGHDLAAILDRRLGEARLSDGAAGFARRLAEGVAAHRDALDGLIGDRARAFPLPAMAPVDRNVLRLALFEICFDNQRVPLPVVINEAVDLAKGYGAESSGRFAHGVLGAIARQRAQGTGLPRPEPAEAAQPGAATHQHSGRTAPDAPGSAP